MYHRIKTWSKVERGVEDGVRRRVLDQRGAELRVICVARKGMRENRLHGAQLSKSPQLVPVVDANLMNSKIASEFLSCRPPR
jgi:hypothetical protein